MDDIKLFAQNDKCLQPLVNMVRKFSDDIGMQFGFQKCAKLSATRGKISLAGPVPTLDDVINELDYGQTYRYLGFPEAGGIDHTASKSIVTIELHRRLKLVWGSLLCGPLKVRATNSFCIPLLSYGFGIVDWSKAEIAQFDVTVRKTLTAANSHHPRAAVERLYLPRKLGGRGLTNIEHLYHRRLVLLSHHLRTSSDDLVQACCELMLEIPSRRSVLSMADDVASSLALGDVLSFSSGQLKIAVATSQREKLLDILYAKPLHGKFFTWVHSSAINPARSFRWLQCSMHGESESSIFAIQDQVLCTRSYQAKIMRISVQSILCRLCQEHEESIQHLLSGCPVLASTSYLHRHNMVARVLHWHLSKCFKLPLSVKYWYDHQPLPVVENSSVKLLWDFSLQTDIHVSSNRPDIVLFLKQEHRIMFFEVSCPADINVPAKEQEKLTKYQPLVREFSECHGQPVDVIPIVFGHSGVVSANQQVYLKQIPDYNETLFNNLQKAAILGTINILTSLNIGYT